jgi:glyoxylase-like metal-dependent hydrolase (beta-lactamase superfamily II)
MKLARLFRTGAFVLVAACAGTALWHPPAAHAAAPLAKEQAPGFYRLMVGDFQVTALSDGTVALPVDQLLTRTTPAQVKKMLARSHLESPLETSVNGYLINTGSKLVLVDTGAGVTMGPGVGGLRANLAAAGYKPEQVDEIYITHMHGDHIGGLLDGANRAFPNATLRIDKRDVDYWGSEANMNAAPAEFRDFFKPAIAVVKAYGEAGKLKPFEGSTALVPGVRAIANYGHTPGHTIYSIESKNEKLVLWGDLMHVAAVQFEDPGVTIQFDSDNAAALKQRQDAFADAAKNGYLVGAAHLAFPGIGRLRAAEKGYVFVPLNYSSLK